MGEDKAAAAVGAVYKVLACRGIISCALRVMSQQLFWAGVTWWDFHRVVLLPLQGARMTMLTALTTMSPTPTTLGMVIPK